MVLSLVGVILVTRMIGPGQYGRFAACLGLFTYLYYATTWGIDIYLMRRPQGEAPAVLYDQAFTLLMALALPVAALGLTLRGTLEALVGVAGFAPLIAVFFLGMPVAVASVPARARLERRLDYRSIAITELTALFQFQATAVGLACLGWGAWSLVTAWVGNQLVTMGMLLFYARHLPRLRFSGPVAGDMLRFGLGCTASVSTMHLRRLVNPLIVTPFAGEAAAGFVGMAEQFVLRLSILKQVAERMSVAALAKVQDQRERVRELLGEGMRMMVLGVGVPLAGFSLAGPWLIPALMGEQWRPVADLVPLLSVGLLVNAVFGLHPPVLQIYRQNWPTALFNAVLMAGVLGASGLLVPRHGALGYGGAELLALPAHLILHLFLQRQVGRPDYLVPLVWTAGLSALMLHPWLGPGAFVAAGLALAWPRTWFHLAGLAAQARQAARAGA